jgi:hypothetical protein
VSENVVLRKTFGPKNEIALSPVVKRPRRAVYHSHPSIVELKNEWSYTFASPIRVYGVDRDNLHFKREEEKGRTEHIAW